MDRKLRPCWSYDQQAKGYTVGDNTTGGKKIYHYYGKTFKPLNNFIVKIVYIYPLPVHAGLSAEQAGTKQHRNRRKYWVYKGKIIQNKPSYPKNRIKEWKYWLKDQVYRQKDRMYE